MADCSIYHNVSIVRQGSSMSCWYACMQMVTRYCRAVGKGNLTDPADDPVLKGLFILNKGIPLAESTRYAKKLGYSAAELSPNLDGLTKLLKKSPLIYAGLWDAEQGHWVIINGIAGDQISVIDPRWGRSFHRWDAYLNGELKQDVDWPFYYVN